MTNLHSLETSKQGSAAALSISSHLSRHSLEAYFLSFQSSSCLAINPKFEIRVRIGSRREHVHIQCAVCFERVPSTSTLDRVLAPNIESKEYRVLYLGYCQDLGTSCLILGSPISSEGSEIVFVFVGKRQGGSELILETD